MIIVLGFVQSKFQLHCFHLCISNNIFNEWVQAANKNVHRAHAMRHMVANIINPFAAQLYVMLEHDGVWQNWSQVHTYQFI